jgi:hypothetical protein
MVFSAIMGGIGAVFGIWAASQTDGPEATLGQIGFLVALAAVVTALADS